MAAIGTQEATRIYTLAAQAGLTEDQVDAMTQELGYRRLDLCSGNRARQIEDRIQSLIPATPAATYADRQAARVARMMGFGQVATGRCHYCGLPLSATGECEECI